MIRKQWICLLLALLLLCPLYGVSAEAVNSGQSSRTASSRQIHCFRNIPISSWFFAFR